MKICIITEGSYPYVTGGVSSWVDTMIRSFPQIDFEIMAILTDRSRRGQFVYELPENVEAVYETYLQDSDFDGGRKSGRRTRLKEKEYQALRSLLAGEEIDWDTVFELFQEKGLSVDNLLMGEDFLNLIQEEYQKKYPFIAFSDFLWTVRSIYMPLFLLLKTHLPKADIYHCVATGYAGVLGSMAKWRYGRPLLISEHGIYTREREEEILKADWVKGIYKNIWIDQFRKMSNLAYGRADLVTSLYEHARELQIEIGCPPDKTRVTPNGIDMARFSGLPGKQPEDEDFINIGAIMRVTPIKDVKTLIRAFAFAKERNPHLKLWIMGNADEEPEYAKECYDLRDAMQVKDIVLTGHVKVEEYLGRMDFTILTSISEGQPLTVLESFAARKPVIATDVGNCRGLLQGESDELGEAGILAHIMNVEELTVAMLELARSSVQRKAMGECGFERVRGRYQIDQMISSYDKIYTELDFN